MPHNHQCYTLGNHCAEFHPIPSVGRNQCKFPIPCKSPLSEKPSLPANHRYSLKFSVKHNEGKFTVCQMNYTECNNYKCNVLHNVSLSIYSEFVPASVAQLDAPSDWRPGGRGFNPRRGRQHSFVEIDHEIFSTVILSLPLIQEGQLSVSGERMCTILVNRLED